MKKLGLGKMIYSQVQFWSTDWNLCPEPLKLWRITNPSDHITNYISKSIMLSPKCMWWDDVPCILHNHWERCQMLYIRLPVWLINFFHNFICSSSSSTRVGVLGESSISPQDRSKTLRKFEGLCQEIHGNYFLNRGFLLWHGLSGPDKQYQHPRLRTSDAKSKLNSLDDLLDRFDMYVTVENSELPLSKTHTSPRHLKMWKWSP